jgi:hypothetical protein
MLVAQVLFKGGDPSWVLSFLAVELCAGNNAAGQATLAANARVTRRQTREFPAASRQVGTLLGNSWIRKGSRHQQNEKAFSRTKDSRNHRYTSSQET